ncbi:hypothetical protein GQ43DRAFT_122279 [Delitschia confertaspora ATCC 74209]|uniref:Only prolin and serin are matching in the corresponding protein n=1 Tax=Delitschia confertaspora ATCC 74209 TaxID=1513339 RepID=A0A9P4JYD7_9PLEO|nr:hypothetical protein GQ43DRAFT_122279 [Delitschia confertaspora ATCC 74209]
MPCQLKTLYLPQLVAARKASKSSLDMSSSDPIPTASLYSCSDSGFYSMSESSTPPTPSLPSRGHLRFPSSASSLSSSPPTHDPIEILNASGKLPKLTEEPIEREDDMVTVTPCCCSCSVEGCDHIRPQTRRSIFGHTYDFSDGYFADDSEYASQHSAKRRRSAESTANSIASKIESRFPSLSRKMRNRGKSFGRVSRSATPSGVPSTRSSSITSTTHQVLDLSEKFSPPSARASNERLDETPIPPPIDVARANALDLESPPEAERLARTPLLPPLMVKVRADDVPTQSPLQSPTVATACQSLVATPVGTPPIRAYPTPPLSTRPSVASFKATRPGHMVASSDIPPIMLTDPNDKWAIKLGHANFTIEPEPYVPEICDTASLRQLFADWEQARCNYTKHQVRTGEHFGVTSKTYELTEQKWREIDEQWKKNNDLAVSRAQEIGEELEPTSPMEPAPLCKMPTLNNPRSEGKFPKLGDEDIVGPMVQIAAQIPQPSGRKRAFLKLLSDIRFPGSFFGRRSK